MRRKNWIWTLLVLATSFLVSACTQNIASGQSLVGTQAPAFQLEDTRGGQTSLSNYTQQDTPVLLFFHMAVG